MFEETTLFGISMAPRSHRRALVVITYAATLFIMAGACLPIMLGAGYARSHWVLGLVLTNPVFLIWFVLLLVISRGVFGRFVRSGFRRSIVGPPPRPVETSLGLAATAPEDEPPTDEREVAARDRAYRLAYKGLVIGSFFILPAMLGCATVASRPAIMIAIMVMFLFLIVAVTLPQVVLLWTEPDLDAEAAERVLA
jgi:hypothetical protein